MKNSVFLSFLIAFFTTALIAQSPVGVWQTIDDNTGDARSYVEIYERGGKFHGKIIKTLRPDAAEFCDKCPGDRKNKPVVGLVIIEGLTPHRDYWRNGTILDPESGNEYGCTIWFENGNTNELKVRGRHWTGIYRTQTWHKVP